MKRLFLILPLLLLAAFPAAADKNPEVEYLLMPGMEGMDLPFSSAVRVDNLLFLSGMLGNVPGTSKLVEGGIQGETRQTLDNIKRVVDKLVVELEAKLGNNDVTLELDDAARDWIAERGYDEKMGARPMARVIQEHIKRPLAEELLFGSLADGGHVRITVNDQDELALDAEPALKELEHLPE